MVCPKGLLASSVSKHVEVGSHLPRETHAKGGAMGAGHIFTPGLQLCSDAHAADL